MVPSLPQGRALRPARWRMAILSGLAVAAVVGGTVLGLPHERVQAQSQAHPPGAPSSFADLVERVKPAVVSIQVTAQGPKIARTPQDPRGQDPRGRGAPRDPGARPPTPFPDENPLDEF